MENPGTWGPVIREINDAVREHREATAKGMVGASVGSEVYWRLVHKGFLTIEAMAAEEEASMRASQ